MTKPTIISSNVDNVAGSKIVGSEEDCPVVIIFIVANMDHGLVPLSYLKYIQSERMTDSVRTIGVLKRFTRKTKR